VTTSTSHSNGDQVVFGADEISLVISQESDRQNGVLFDSQSSSFRAHRDTHLDTRLLYEMMFGTVPLAHGGLTTKVHIVPRSRQLLITKVFRVTFTPTDESAVLSPNMSSSSSSSTSSLSSMSGSMNFASQQRSWKRTFAVVLMFNDALPVFEVTAVRSVSGGARISKVSHWSTRRSPTKTRSIDVPPDAGCSSNRTLR
jgi:hypothetical protein